MGKRKLTPRQAIFVSEYLRHSNATRAAIAAGYRRKSARQQGSDLLTQCPAVKEAIAAVRRGIVERGKYNLQKAMQECENAIRFCIETRSATALPRLLELRMKLNGLLIDRHELKVQPVDITAALAEAKKRALAPPPEPYIPELVVKKLNT